MDFDDTEKLEDQSSADIENLENVIEEKGTTDKSSMVKRAVGRPKGSKTKPKTKKTRNTEKKWTCYCCGREFGKQANVFCTTKSDIYAYNNGYTPICKDCVNKLYKQLVQYFDNNEYAALERVCQILDWYYNDDIAYSVISNPDCQYPATMYPAKMSMHQYINLGSTYLDTIRDRERLNAGKDKKEPQLQIAKNGETYYGETTEGADETLAKKWGNRYSAEQLEIMESHYNELHEAFSSITVVQEALVFDLCRIRAMQNRALNAGNIDEYDKLSKLYQSTLKTANFEPKKKDVSSEENETWGTFLRTIERYTPAEYYKDKKIFRDFDGIKEYFKRFVLRPMKNLMTGSNEQDEEYSIKDDE